MEVCERRNEHCGGREAPFIIQPKSVLRESGARCALVQSCRSWLHSAFLARVVPASLARADSPGALAHAGLLLLPAEPGGGRFDGFAWFFMVLTGF